MCVLCLPLSSTTAGPPLPSWYYTLSQLGQGKASPSPTRIANFNLNPPPPPWARIDASLFAVSLFLLAQRHLARLVRVSVRMQDIAAASKHAHQDRALEKCPKSPLAKEPDPTLQPRQCFTGAELVPSEHKDRSRLERLRSARGRRDCDKRANTR